jgi:hypothetical protein
MHLVSTWLAVARSVATLDTAGRFLVGVSRKMGAVEGRVERPEVTLE